MWVPANDIANNQKGAGSCFRLHFPDAKVLPAGRDSELPTLVPKVKVNLLMTSAPSAAGELTGVSLRDPHQKMAPARRASFRPELNPHSIRLVSAN